MRAFCVVLSLAVVARAGDVLSANDLERPTAVEAGGAPIDLADGTGHAAPLVLDWDGDGKRDLLVGQFSGGKLRIYRNVGENDEMKFEGFTWFQAGGEDALVPTG